MKNSSSIAAASIGVALTFFGNASAANAQTTVVHKTGVENNGASSTALTPTTSWVNLDTAALAPSYSEYGPAVMVPSWIKNIEIGTPVEFIYDHFSPPPKRQGKWNDKSYGPGIDVNVQNPEWRVGFCTPEVEVNYVDTETSYSSPKKRDTAKYVGAKAGCGFTLAEGFQASFNAGIAGGGYLRNHPELAKHPGTFHSGDMLYMPTVSIGAREDFGSIANTVRHLVFPESAYIPPIGVKAVEEIIPAAGVQESQGRLKPNGVIAAKFGAAINMGEVAQWAFDLTSDRPLESSDIPTR